jgi:UDP-N-acetylglucosamine 4,6-dehydratase
MSTFDWTTKSVLVTGGAGSFGRKFVEMLLKKHRPARLAIFSRDEWKHSQMRADLDHPSLRWFIGDVRDRDRLYRALEQVDVVIHAAALKQVPAAEYNPFEAVQTNVLGAQNVIDACIDKGVSRVIALSTDKACNPINLYGATKLCSDKLFVAGNFYVGKKRTLFSVVRYGNVVGSRGSVIPLFREQAKTGTITITDERMTRFWITLEEGANFVIRCVEQMHGGEIFVPKIPSMNIMELAAVVAPGCRKKVVGIRPGEKLHEVLIGADDARRTLEFDDFYVIQPDFEWWSRERWSGGKPLEENFIYSSDQNPKVLDRDDLAAMVTRL